MTVQIGNYRLVFRGHEVAEILFSCMQVSQVRYTHKVGGGKQSTILQKKNVYIYIRMFTYYIPFMKRVSGEATFENH